MGNKEIANSKTNSKKTRINSWEDLSINPQRDNSSLEIRQCLDDKRGRFEKCSMESNLRQERKDFYIYFLRRPDKIDPIEPWNNQPFYVGKGSNGRYLEHRKEADYLLNKPGRKTCKIIEELV